MKREKWQPPPDVIARLGKVTDTILARECGVAQATITARRNELGIPPTVMKPRIGKRGPNKRIPIRETAKAVVEAARPVSGGMLIPFDLFAQLAASVFGSPAPTAPTEE